MRTHYEAHLVVAEVKNLSRRPGKDEILQVANYLNPRGTGLFALILARAELGPYRPVDLPGAVGPARQAHRGTQRRGRRPDGENPDWPAVTHAELVRQKIEDFRLGI